MWPRVKPRLLCEACRDPDVLVLPLCLNARAALPLRYAASLPQGSEVGCYGHPSSATQANMAAVVETFVANLTQWTPAATQTPLSTDIPMIPTPGGAPVPEPLHTDTAAPLIAPMMAPMPVYPAGSVPAPELAPVMAPLPASAALPVPDPVPVPMPAPMAVPVAAPLPGPLLPLPTPAAAIVPAPDMAPMAAAAAVPLPAPTMAPMATASIGSDFTAPSI